MAVDAGRIQIPAGFGEVPVAVKDNTFDLATPLEAAAKIQQDQAVTQDTQAASQLRQAEIPGEVAKSSLATMDTNDAQIAQVMRGIDWSDPNAAANGDAALGKLVDGGNEAAQQYIGKLSPATTDRLTESLDASAVRQRSSAAGQLAGTPEQNTGQGTPEQMRQQLNQLPDDQLQLAAKTIGDHQAAALRVYHAADPAKQWDLEAPALGHPEMVGRYNQMTLSSILAETEQVQPIVQSVLDQRQIGLPGAPSATEYKEVGGNLYAIDPYAKGGATVKPVTDNATLVGTDSEGRAIYKGPNGETVGSHPLSAKPGSGDHDSRFNEMHDAWIAAHPGDEAGALRYAGGTGGTLTPVQIQQSAAAQAARDLQAASASGNPPTDANTYLAQQTQLHVGELTSAAASAASPGGAGAPAPAAPGGPPPALQDDQTPVRTNFGYAISSLQQQVAAAKPGTPNYVQLQRNLAKAQADAAQHLQPIANGGTLPARALAALKQAGEGVPHAFVGSGWMLKDGQPVRLW